MTGGSAGVGALAERLSYLLPLPAGLTALGIFAQHDKEIRLLILDADLPARSGPDCLRELRDKGVKTPAIVITGNVDFESSELDDETVLLRKPFGMPELAGTVSVALGTDAGQEMRS